MIVRNARRGDSGSGSRAASGRGAEGSMDPQSFPVELDDGDLRLSFDAKGRIVRFASRATGAEYLTRPGLEDNWRVLVLGDGYPVYYVLGKEQTPDAVERDGNRVTFRYDTLRRAGVTYPI